MLFSLEKSFSTDLKPVTPFPKIFKVNVKREALYKTNLV